MKTLLLTLTLAFILSACAALDNIGDTSRTDSVSLYAVVESVSYAQLQAICYPRPALACTKDGRMYVQGDFPTSSLKLTVQYLSWGDLGDKCGRFTGEPTCYAQGTLYTSSTYLITDDYNNEVVGKILADAMGIDFGGENRERQAGHEFQHLLGQPDTWFVEGSSHLGR